MSMYVCIMGMLEKKTFFSNKEIFRPKNNDNGHVDDDDDDHIYGDKDKNVISILIYWSLLLLLLSHNDKFLFLFLLLLFFLYNSFDRPIIINITREKKSLPENSKIL